MLRTHYSLMNMQEESLDRKLPIPFVMYNFFLCLLHSGMTVEAALKLNDEKFGQLFSECCQVNTDVGIVPYKRDFAPGFTVSMTGGLKLVARDTENMVPPLPPSPCFGVRLTTLTMTLAFDRPCLAVLPSSWGARYAPWHRWVSLPSLQ
jgi:hypothetical protein